MNTVLINLHKGLNNRVYIYTHKAIGNTFWYRQDLHDLHESSCMSSDHQPEQNHSYLALFRKLLRVETQYYRTFRQKRMLKKVESDQLLLVREGCIGTNHYMTDKVK